MEQLAASCDVSVDTVRYYQSRGLLEQPQREGRVAWYDDGHVLRIRRIRELQAKGLTLAAIGRVLRGELGGADADLVAAVAAARGEPADDGALTLDELANAAGVPASLIQAVEREGIAIGRRVDGELRYGASDIEVVRTALRLLEFGLPVGDLLALARDTDAALRGLAKRAVDLFEEHVRAPIKDTMGDEPTASTQMVEAFETLLPAVTDLVANHFRRVVLEEAEERIET